MGAQLHRQEDAQRRDAGARCVGAGGTERRIPDVRCAERGHALSAAPVRGPRRRDRTRGGVR